MGHKLLKKVSGYLGFSPMLQIIIIKPLLYKNFKINIVILKIAFIFSSSL